MEKSKLNKNKKSGKWRRQQRNERLVYMGSQTLMYIFFSYSFPNINIYCFLPN